MSIFERNSETQRKGTTPIWFQIALASIAMVVSILGVNNPQFSWLVYIGVFILIISLIVIVSESFIGKYILQKYKNAETRRIFNKNELEYLSFIENSRIIDELMTEINRLPWSNKKPACLANTNNSIYDLNNQIKFIPAGAKIIFANSLLREIILTADNYLYACDNTLREGNVKYDNEHHTKRVKKLLRKYENFIEIHNLFCKNVNTQLKAGRLNEICGHDLVFDWSKAQPDA